MSEKVEDFENITKKLGKYLKKFVGNFEKKNDENLNKI